MGYGRVTTDERGHMAQRTTVVFSSDLSGEEAEDVRTRTVALDGRTVELDLTEKESDELDDVLAVYFDNGRKVSARAAQTTARTRRASNGSRGSADREQNQAVRAWAKGQGYELSERGRIPGHVQQAFDAAH